MIILKSGYNAFMMKEITANTKVARVIKEYPETINVFLDYGCPDMRNGFFSFMAKIMSIRNAAMVHRIPLDELLEDLETAISESEDETLANS